MSEPDKYRAQAHLIVEQWRGDRVMVYRLHPLEAAIATALAEAAREGMERAIVISIREAEAWSADRVGHSIAEAIRKEMP